MSSVLIGFAIYAAGIFICGLPVAKASLWMYRKYGGPEGILGALLFPLTTYIEHCPWATNDPNVAPLASTIGPDEEKDYVRWSSICWPWRIICNVLSTAVILADSLFAAVFAFRRLLAFKKA